MKRIGRYRFAERQLGHVASAHYGVIHQRAGHHLTVFAIEHFLPQRFAEALRDAAVNLSFDDHRIDDNAAVVDQDEFFDSRVSCFAVNADHAHVRAKTPRLASRIEEAGLLQTELHTARNLAGISGSGDLWPG